ncbi:mus81 structure-specific endonuclease subunit isoform X3 [Lasioglossum baleicum]|uniref:mus81 structure-specific endonuclease subunit isoform X3 n=1 Tax=Lasioglossum baleicum TaxID=434251 RepID=UPI003FCC5360
MKRVKMKVKRPNPLFELWLEEWRQKASSQNSDMQYHFSKALASLKKYPLPLKSGKDCLILQHFGTKLCSLLDKKLEKYKAENGGLISTDDIICIHCNNIKEPKRKHKSQPVSITAENPTPKKTELAELSKCNLPSWNLENYAVLMILYKKTQEIYSSGFVVEEDLLLEVKNLCGNASKNSIMSFFDNGLVFRLSTPIRYTLTEAGINISKKICEITATDANLVISSDVLNNIQARLVALFPQKSEKADAKSCDNSGLNTQPSGEHRKNIPNSLTKSSQVENCRSPEKLTRNKRNVQQSSQCSTQKKSKGNDVIEIPDRLNDVNSDASNKENGRILSVDHVQKRIYLKSSKFDIILLVDTQETCGGKTKPQHDVTLSELSQFGVLFEVRHLKVGDFAWIARCRNTSNELILPYIVERKRIDDLSASITDGRFHEQKKKNLVGCKKETLPQADILVDTVNLMEFEEFNKAASKQKVFKVTQMFVRQLLQLKGVSVEKAFAIVERYPTPKVLVNAFQQSDCNGELLLSNVQAENKKQVLGPVISKTICQLYTNKTLS